VGALREALQQAGAREALAQVTPLISGVPIVLLPCRKAQLALAPDDPVLQQVSRRASGCRLPALAAFTAACAIFFRSGAAIRRGWRRRAHASIPLQLVHNHRQ
jgi:hypothetical protein